MKLSLLALFFVMFASSPSFAATWCGIVKEDYKVLSLFDNDSNPDISRLYGQVSASDKALLRVPNCVCINARRVVNRTAGGYKLVSPQWVRLSTDLPACANLDAIIRGQERASNE